MNFQTILAQLQHDKAIPFAIPIFLLAMLVEWYLCKEENPELYKRKDIFVSLSMGILSGIVEFFPKVLAFIAFYYLHEISPLRDIVGRQWWAWIILFFLDDFAYYWFHRMNHEVRLFWAGHVPHHSSIKYNYGTALRQGVGERVHKFLFWLWIPLLGFDPLMMYSVMRRCIKNIFIPRRHFMHKVGMYKKLVNKIYANHYKHH